MQQLFAYFTQTWIGLRGGSNLRFHPYVSILKAKTLITLIAATKRPITVRQQA